MKVLKKFVGLISLFSLLFIVGCAPGMLMSRPMPPSPPRGEFKTVRDIIVTPVNLDSNVDPSLKVTKNQTIAIMNFKEPEGSGAGTLVADSFILDLQRKGYKVIEREQIEKIMKEQGLVSQGTTKLSELDIAKKLGKLLAADYFVFGAVTEYKSENKEISVTKVIPDSEFERYERQYNEYMSSCRTAQMMGGMPCSQIKSAQEFRDADFKDKRELARIANVGLTAKLVEIHTSKIMWVGQASLTDEKQQDGMKRIVESMTKNFLKI